MELAVGLTRAVERSGIPIHGVSIGRAEDRATWRVQFTDAATSQQRTQAASIVAAYDVASDTALKAELAEKAMALKALASLARATWEYLPPAVKPTWADFLARWKAIYLA